MGALPQRSVLLIANPGFLSASLVSAAPHAIPHSFFNPCSRGSQGRVRLYPSTVRFFSATFGAPNRIFFIRCQEFYRSPVSARTIFPYSTLSCLIHKSPLLPFLTGYGLRVPSFESGGFPRKVKRLNASVLRRDYSRTQMLNPLERISPLRYLLVIYPAKFKLFPLSP